MICLKPLYLRSLILSSALSLVLVIAACKSDSRPTESDPQTPIEDTIKSGPYGVQEEVAELKAIDSWPKIDSADYSTYELNLLRSGLVDLHTKDPSILVDLKYRGSDNFTGSPMYPPDFNSVFLQAEAADMLIAAHAELKRIRPDLRFLVYDAVRPFSAQQKMWQLVKGTEMQRYVAVPARHSASLHNYGSAVDLTLVDSLGFILDMGTDFDHLGPLAEPRYHQKFLASGELTQEQVDNRMLLKRVMRSAGFQAILREWWHFNAKPKSVAREIYTLIE